MRADEIREMGAEDIPARILELEEERFRLKFRSATEPLEDPLRLRREYENQIRATLNPRTRNGSQDQGKSPPASPPLPPDTLPCS